MPTPIQLTINLRVADLFMTCSFLNVASPVTFTQVEGISGGEFYCCCMDICCI